MTKDPNSTCPLCKSIRFGHIATLPYQQGNAKNTVELYRCMDCTCEFLSPFPSDSALFEIYQNVYQNQIEHADIGLKNKPSDNQNHSQRKNFLYTWYRALRVFLKKHLPKSITKILTFPHRTANLSYYDIIYKFTKNKELNVFDIGCGNGWFLESLIKSPLFNINRSMGFDFSHYATSLCRKRGIHATDNLGEIHEKFNLVVLIHFLEHTKNPFEILKKISQILTNDGLVFVALPNTSGLGKKMKKKSWEGYNAPRHVINYNKKSLNVLFQSQDFTMIYHTTRDFYADPEGITKKYPFLQKVVFSFVHVFRLGDEQIGLFRKIT